MHLFKFNLCGHNYCINTYLQPEKKNGYPRSLCKILNGRFWEPTALGIFSQGFGTALHHGPNNAGPKLHPHGEPEPGTTLQTLCQCINWPGLVDHVMHHAFCLIYIHLQ